MADLTDLQAAQTIKIAGADSAGIETGFCFVDANQNLAVRDFSNGTTGSAVPTVTSQVGGSDGTNLRTLKTDTSGQLVVVGPGTAGVLSGGVLTVQLSEPQTYSGSATAFAVATTPTDVFTITGSASKTIRVSHIRLSLSTSSGSAIRTTFQLIRRSTANTGGTSTAVTMVPHDSTNAAATATALFYTANPTTLGTSIGVVRADSTSVANTGIPSGVLEWDFNSVKEQPMFLRGTSQILAVNFSSTSITGSIVSINVEWIEV